MELERSRGISISSTAMTWNYNGEQQQQQQQYHCWKSIADKAGTLSGQVSRTAAPGGPVGAAATASEAPPEGHPVNCLHQSWCSLSGAACLVQEVMETMPGSPSSMGSCHRHADLIDTKPSAGSLSVEA
jgi:hypothetical protein